MPPSDAEVMCGQCRAAQRVSLELERDAAERCKSTDGIKHKGIQTMTQSEPDMQNTDHDQNDNRSLHQENAAYMK